MKLFTTILASFMLSVFFFSGTANASVKTAAIHYGVDNSPERSPSHEEQNCPLFCAACACCQVVETKQTAVPALIWNDVSGVVLFGFLSSRPEDIALPVWHPPQSF